MRRALVGYALVKRTLLRAALLLAIAGWASLTNAQSIDLLTGRVDNAPLCALSADAATELFGIPSRKVDSDANLVIEYAHRGFILRFPTDAPDATLAEVEVYPVNRNGIMGYRGHFLGTVASGTTREPVERILRSVRAEIVSDDVDTVAARGDGFELEIAFLYGVIDIVTFRCTPTEG